MITYCTNIHPGENWDDTFVALRCHIPSVKAAFQPNAAFPIGLRLSNRAALELVDAEDARFIAWLRDSDCFVPTLNGFPFGAFHGQRIKENVYMPDWRSPERVAYSCRLADLLAGWVPAGMAGSISTVPLGFKGLVSWQDMPAFRRSLESVLRHLANIRDRRDRKIVLALEPEPGCLLETTDDVCRLFAELSLPADLKSLLGLCYDCCHQAVEFEDPIDSLTRLEEADIPIAKVQVSSALSVSGDLRERLRRFDEPCYLHQVVVKHRDRHLERYDDLGEALEHADPGDEWRCHFHVPIFLADTPEYGTTRSFLTTILPRLPDDMLLEVETYTWDVLPPELRHDSVTDSIVRELIWLDSQRHA